MLLDLGEMKERNRLAGHHWFSAGAMRFFASRVSSRVYPCADGGAYFVSSERFVDCWGRADARGYTVRFMSEDGVVHDVSEFQEYGSLCVAHRAARRARRERVGYVRAEGDRWGVERLESRLGGRG